jgi:hypothetical protein
MARRILTEFVMDKIAAVDRPCQEHATVTIMKRDFSDKQRKKDAKSGAAMPGGGFPIENTRDLHNAVRAIGRAKNPAAAKAHIRQRAKALGVGDPFAKEFESDLDAMEVFKQITMLRADVLKVKTNEMLEMQEDDKGGGGKMPRRGPVKRNSQPMVKAVDLEGFSGKKKKLKGGGPKF